MSACVLDEAATLRLDLQNTRQDGNTPAFSHHAFPYVGGIMVLLHTASPNPDGNQGDEEEACKRNHSDD